MKKNPKNNSVPDVPLHDLVKPRLMEYAKSIGVPIRGTKEQIIRRIRIKEGTANEIDLFLEGKLDLIQE